MTGGQSLPVSCNCPQAPPLAGKAERHGGSVLLTASTVRPSLGANVCSARRDERVQTFAGISSSSGANVCTFFTCLPCWQHGTAMKHHAQRGGAVKAAKKLLRQ